jgi:hypothetical protein
MLSFCKLTETDISKLFDDVGSSIIYTGEVVPDLSLWDNQQEVVTQESSLSSLMIFVEAYTLMDVFFPPTFLKKYIRND